MKWITVQEYAKKQGICLAAAYKRVTEGRVETKKQFGRIVVKP